MWASWTFLACLAASVGVFIYRSEGFTRRRQLRAIQHYRIADLPEVTIGRIVGVARPLDGKTVTAPFSGRACLWYFVRVIDQTPPDGRVPNRAPMALLIGEESGGTPFVLEDASGVATVDPERAVSALDGERTTTSILGATLSPGQQAFLERVKATRYGSDSIKWFEAIVEPGETIAVAGYGQRLNGKLRMSSSPHLPLVIGDNPSTTRA